MAAGRGREQWLHTGMVLVQQANLHRDPKTKREPYKLEDFDPYERKARERREAAEVSKEAKKGADKTFFSVLKTVFVDLQRGK